MAQTYPEDTLMHPSQKKAFASAIRYIYQNIDEPFTLEILATELGISVSSLKRIFTDATGFAAGRFIRRIRMEYAFKGLKTQENSILEIALSAGFKDHSAFTRRFKENFGYSPSGARSTINIVNALECITLEEPILSEIDAFTLYGITMQGRYFEAAPLAWDALKHQLPKNHLDEDFAGTFIGVGHENPHDGHIAENQVHFSAGVTHTTRDLPLEKIVISKGKYAKFNYTGNLNNLGLAYHYIYGTWNTKSTLAINTQIPAFIQFENFPKNTNDQNVVIYAPLHAQ